MEDVSRVGAGRSSSESVLWDAWTSLRGITEVDDAIAAQGTRSKYEGNVFSGKGLLGLFAEMML
jgi:hypothetical protein